MCDFSNSLKKNIDLFSMTSKIKIMHNFKFVVFLLEKLNYN